MGQPSKKEKSAQDQRDKPRRETGCARSRVSFSIQRNEPASTRYHIHLEMLSTHLFAVKWCVCKVIVLKLEQMERFLRLPENTLIVCVRN